MRPCAPCGCGAVHQAAGFTAAPLRQAPYTPPVPVPNRSPCLRPPPVGSTLFGLALSNLGVVPADAPHVYGVVNAYLLPLAVPLLLFAADLR